MGIDFAPTGSVGHRLRDNITNTESIELGGGRGRRKTAKDSVCAGITLRDVFELFLPPPRAPHFRSQLLRFYCSSKRNGQIKNGAEARRGTREREGADTNALGPTDIVNRHSKPLIDSTTYVPNVRIT